MYLEIRANRQSMNMTASHDNFHKWAMVDLETTVGRVQETVRARSNGSVNCS